MQLLVTAASYLPSATTYIPFTMLGTLYTSIPDISTKDPNALSSKVNNIAFHVFAAATFGLFLYLNPNVFFAGIMVGLFAHKIVERCIIQQSKLIWESTGKVQKIALFLLGAYIKMPIFIPTVNFMSTAALGAYMILRYEWAEEAKKAANPKKTT